MKKAKSRLAQLTPTESRELVETKPDRRSVESKFVGKKHSSRLKHWPTLVLGLLFGLALLFLFFFVSPQSVQNWLIPNSYLPFFACLFGTNFFLFSFFFLDSAIGMWWTILICSFTFLKIQQVIFTWPMIVVFLLGAVVGMAIYFLRLKNRAVNQSSK